MTKGMIVTVMPLYNLSTYERTETPILTRGVLPMDTIDVIAVLALVVFGMVAGFFVSRHSQSRQPIHGGPLARVLNYAASALLISLAPTMLTMIFIIHPAPLYIGETRLPPILILVVIAASLMGGALLLLMPYGMIEASAKASITEEDRGWTEQDARSSGL